MRWLLLMTMTLQVATCGQTGPLTLPEEDRGSRWSDSARASEADAISRLAGPLRGH